VSVFRRSVFGDFEDLETGETTEGDDRRMIVDDEQGDEQHIRIATTTNENISDVDGRESSALRTKKANLKSQFDAEYDQSKDGESAYLDELKKEVELQSHVRTRSTGDFDGLDRDSFLVESVGIRRHARRNARPLRRLSSRNVRTL
jgi:hypothetical protein